MAFAQLVRIGPWGPGTLQRCAKGTPAQPPAQNTEPVPVQHPPRSCPGGKIPQAPDLSGLRSRRGATGLTISGPGSPGAEEGQQSQAPGFTPKTQGKFVFFLTLGNFNPRDGEAAGHYPEFSWELSFE